MSPLKPRNWTDVIDVFLGVFSRKEKGKWQNLWRWDVQLHRNFQLVPSEFGRIQFCTNWKNSIWDILTSALFKFIGKSSKFGNQNKTYLRKVLQKVSPKHLVYIWTIFYFDYVWIFGRFPPMVSEISKLFKTFFTRKKHGEIFGEFIPYTNAPFLDGSRLAKNRFSFTAARKLLRHQTSEILV